MIGLRAPQQPARRVRVPGREDLGEVLESGHNFGDTRSIRCVGVHFPLDGLCAYYAVDKVTFIDVEE
jgi:hypothetical protein